MDRLPIPSLKKVTPRLGLARALSLPRIATLLAAMMVLFVERTEAGETQAVPQGLTCLAESYPDLIERAEGNTLIFRDGTTMTYDDGRFRTHDQKLTDPDLEDQMSQHYPLSSDYLPLAEDFEPGRIRYEPLFREMYGATKTEVQENLESVTWVDGTTIQVTNVNDVAQNLRSVVRDLKLLLGNHPEYEQYLTNIGGTFNWRVIAGTDRLSMHSFAICLDVNVKNGGDYWRWNGGPEPYKNRLPYEIVEIFEKHGFIWGGKWYHYDTMHFEYRPELLHEDCAR